MKPFGKSMAVLPLLIAGIAIAPPRVSGAADASAQDKKAAIVGCAVKGDGDGDGFLLANDPDKDTLARVLYWLDDDDDKVSAMMGQLVEVTGEVEGDIKKGEIKTERENGMIELEINAAGRKANVKLAEVPAAIGTPGSVRDREETIGYIVRKLDVKSAKVLATTCK